MASRRLVIFEGNVAPLDDTIGEQHQQIVLLEVDVSLPEATGTSTPSGGSTTSGMGTIAPRRSKSGMA